MRIRNPFAKTLSGTLRCPHCGKYRLEFVEDTRPDEKRYKCRDCGGYVRYQYRYKPQENDKDVYSGHKRGINLDVGKRFFSRRTTT